MKHLFLHHYDLFYGSGRVTERITAAINDGLGEALMIAGRRHNETDEWVRDNPHVQFVKYPSDLKQFDLPLDASMSRETFDRYEQTFKRNLKRIGGTGGIHVVNHGFVWAKILRDQGLPYVVELHGTDEKVFMKPGYRSLREIQEENLDGALKIICQSSDHMDRARFTYNLPKEKFAYLHSGIDSSYFMPLELDRSEVLEYFGVEPVEGPVISYIGRLSEEKSVDTLIDAVEGLDVTTIIVGDGPHGDELRDQAQRNSNIHFVGRRDPHEIRNLYNVCDLMVMPGFETFGLAVLEAMSCGTPVIGRNSGGTWDTIGMYDTRLTYDGTPEDLREKIETNLEIPRDGNDLHAYVERLFDYKKNVAVRANFLKSLF